MVASHKKILVHRPETGAHVHDHVICSVLNCSGIQRKTNRTRHIPYRQKGAAEFLGYTESRFVFCEANVPGKREEIRSARHLHAFNANYLFRL